MVQVRATDRDIGINSVLSYYITEGNEDMTFRMDRISGEIATRPAPPDRERQNFYHLVVTVEDEGTPTLSVSNGGGWDGSASCVWEASCGLKLLIALKPLILPRLHALRSQAKSLTGQVCAKRGTGDTVLSLSEYPVVSLTDAII